MPMATNDRIIDTTPLDVRAQPLIKSGRYQQVLDRWNLASEAIDPSRTNPPGLPKS